MLLTYPIALQSSAGIGRSGSITAAGSKAAYLDQAHTPTGGPCSEDYTLSKAEGYKQAFVHIEDGYVQPIEMHNLMELVASLLNGREKKR